MIKVTEVKIKPYKGKGSLVAFADVVFNDSLRVNGVKVLDGRNGLFVNMPSNKIEKDGEVEWRDIVFPINKESRKEIQDNVLAAYKKEIGGNTKDKKDDDLFG